METSRYRRHFKIVTDVVERATWSNKLLGYSVCSMGIFLFLWAIILLSTPPLFFWTPLFFNPLYFISCMHTRSFGSFSPALSLPSTTSCLCTGVFYMFIFLRSLPLTDKTSHHSAAPGPFCHLSPPLLSVIYGLHCLHPAKPTPLRYIGRVCLCLCVGVC